MRALRPVRLPEETEPVKILDDYFTLQKEIYEYFGYDEGWRVLPLDDCREMFWYADEKYGLVRFAKTEKELQTGDGECYSNDIYHKHVYRRAECTAIGVDTSTDGNMFLQIFDNAKERPEMNSDE